MADATNVKTEDAPKPLTVAEVASFDLPPFLHGARLTQDVNGGFSYRWHAGGFSYIATPEPWEGRTLTSGGSSMGSFATNGVTDLHTQATGTLETNDPNINRSLVPTDDMAGSSSTSCPAPDPSIQPHFSSHPAFLPGIVGGALVLVFIATLIVGAIAYLAGRHVRGNS